MQLDIGKQFLLNKEFEEAKNFFLNLLEKDNKSFRLLFYLGFTFFELNEFSKSVYYYKLALKNKPTSIEIMLNLANAQYTIGNFLSAKSLFLKIIRLDNFNSKAYYGLYLINPNFLNNKHYSLISEIKHNKKIDLYDESINEFLLSKKEKANKDLEQELIHLRKHHEICFKFNLNFNTQGLFYYDQIISKYYKSIEFLNNNLKSDGKNLNDLSPIFIVGLPRSGSTLVESIISSGEEKVHSLGETAVINLSILDQIKHIIFKDNFNKENFNFHLDYGILKETVYKKYLSYLGNESKILFIDKSLENFFNIEVILKIFPKAKIIHCKRNYRDAIISIYQSMLPSLPWAHSLKDICNYTDKYIKITEYFQKKYPKNILTINLEDLTIDKTDTSKKIFEFINLKWSEQIFKFYKRKNLNIKTLSNAQLRTQIFNYEKSKYHSYFFLLDNFYKNYSWLD